MIELQIPGLKGSYNKFLKKYKNDDYLEDLWVELEELLGAIDDTLRGAD